MCVTLEILREFRYGRLSQDHQSRAPFQGMFFVSPPCGVVGPPFMATLNLPGLTIGLHAWLFSNPFIPNASFVLDPSPLPHQYQPHVNPSPSSLNV